MVLERFLVDPPELGPPTGTKRLLALPDSDRETKRLYSERYQWPCGNGDVELNNGLDSRADDSTLLNPEFSNTALQYGNDFGTEWSNATPQDNFGGVDMTLYPVSADSGSFVFEPMYSQQVGMDVQTSQRTEVFHQQFETPWSTNSFDMNHSFYANQTITPSLEISQDLNYGYDCSLSEDWIPPKPSCEPFQGPPIDDASTSIDMVADADNTGGYRLPESFTHEESDIETPEVKSEGVAIVIGSW